MNPDGRITDSKFVQLIHALEVSEKVLEGFENQKNIQEKYKNKQQMKKKDCAFSKNCSIAHLNCN